MYLIHAHFSITAPTVGVGLIHSFIHAQHLLLNTRFPGWGTGSWLSMTSFGDWMEVDRQVVWVRIRFLDSTVLTENRLHLLSGLIINPMPVTCGCAAAHFHSAHRRQVVFVSLLTGNH